MNRWLVVGGLVALMGPLGTANAIAQMQSKDSPPIRGIVRALHQASIGTDLPVKVVKINFREAEAFRKGDTLVTFDCRRLEAEHQAAVATSREMSLNLKSQTYLDSRGAVGKLDVEISKARADKAEAEATAIAARIAQCTIVAPFDGRVTELKINEHEVPASGQPFISLVDETQFQIELILPSNALRSLETGSSFQFQVDETGISYGAKLERIGAVVDPVSQSIKAIATFETPDRRIIAGMSGTAVIPSLEAVK